MITFLINLYFAGGITWFFVQLFFALYSKEYTYAWLSILYAIVWPISLVIMLYTVRIKALYNLVIFLSLTELTYVGFSTYCNTFSPFKYPLPQLIGFLFCMIICWGVGYWFKSKIK